jgi:oxygen-independent coproporphyrinogen-3 oxidase
MPTAFDIDLVRRYDGHGPRYTSYPTAPHFDAGFDAGQYRLQTERSNAEAGPLSLYVHLPFCPSPCFYCACTRLITRQPAVVEGYLDRLLREVAMQGALFNRSRTVEQIAWGGGTPTYLTPVQIEALMTALGRYFTLSRSGRREFTVEIDPRTVETDTIATLAALGFNRASLGVQDFDPVVQRAVNRVQPVSQVAKVLAQLRRAGFDSVNFDLIYGLPKQTRERFAVTLRETVAMRPDRIALYSYAHLPELFKPQKRIVAADLPSPEVKLSLLERAVETLGEAGYVYIGMDHFALPGDELVAAQREGRLHRNFQGYSTHRGCDLVGLGLSAISNLAGSYSQHDKTLGGYQAAIDGGRLPVVRGLRLDDDDLLRRDVIQALMCHPRLDFAEIERRHGILFTEYFRHELVALAPLEADGLVFVDPAGIDVRPAGRLLLRSIAMVFDAYLRRQEAPARYSKVI